MKPRLTPGHRRRAALGRCPRCKAPILAGHDDLGLPVNVDPTPITRTAELQLFLAGRPTYEVSRGELVHRDRWRIRRPASGGVVPEHVCNLHLDPGLLEPPRPIAPVGTTDLIPF